MSKEQNLLLNKKRERNINFSKKLDITLDQKEIFIQKDNLNYRIILSSILENGKNKILIVCNHVKSPIKYEKEVGLEILRDLSKTFRICNNLEEAFKMLKNLFNKKKVIIKEHEDNLIIINFTIHNCIEYKEESVNINLERRDNFSKAQNNKEINNKISNNIVSNTNKNATKNEKEKVDYSEIEQKIKLLFKNDEDKDLRIRNLIINGGEMLYDCYKIKKELKEIKRFIQYNERNNIFIKSKEKKENDDNEEKDIKGYESGDEKENVNEIQIKKRDKKVKEVKIKSQKTRFQCTNIIIPPKMIFCKNITDKATWRFWGDNNFIIFDSIYKEKYLVYGTKNYTIHFYDLNLENVTKRIKKAHDYEITNFRHIFDKNYIRDLLLTISDQIKNIKIWDVKNADCLVNIRKAYDEGFLFSACFLIDQIHKINYIISINYDKEFLKIYDFEGKIVNKIDGSQDKSYLVDTFFNSYQKKYYIIVGNDNYIVSYFFETRTIYKKYYDQGSTSMHMNFVLNFRGKEINLIECDTSGYVRIWDFDTGLLLNKYTVGKKLKLGGICLWDKNFLFVGSNDKKIKIIDLENGSKIDSIRCNNTISTIKKVNHPIYGECLLFVAKSNDGFIQMWKNEN